MFGNVISGMDVLKKMEVRGSCVLNCTEVTNCMYPVHLLHHGYIVQSISAWSMIPKFNNIISLAWHWIF